MVFHRVPWCPGAHALKHLGITGLKQDVLSTLLFNFALEYILGRSKKTWRNGNWMEHINFWFMQMILIYWENHKYHKHTSITY
jgi:hypothetical protein